MRRLMLSSAVLVVAVAGVPRAGEIESGLEVGKPATPFNVRDITGPNQGKTLCYR